MSFEYNDIILTIDIDWAPDFIIEDICNILLEYRVKSTWFVTHASQTTNKLRMYPELFELGIHPNFNINSSHGNSTEQILNHCIKLVPEAKSMRTHGLVQSTKLLRQILTETNITTDVSLYLPNVKNIVPFLHSIISKRHLLRIPYIWEDDLNIEQINPKWSIKELIELGCGLKILDFHPIHIFLNSADMVSYSSLKYNFPNLQELNSTVVTPYINHGIGTRTMFIEAVKYLALTGCSCFIKDLHDKWFETNLRGHIT